MNNRLDEIKAREQEIPERHMKQARRVDNGELIQGYCCKMVTIEQGVTKLIEVIQCIVSGCELRNYLVAPATVEDVPVKPIEIKSESIHGLIYYQCPNCNDDVCDEPNHCSNCGQRIDWSDTHDR